MCDLEHQNEILNSIEIIYSNVNVPIILCNEELLCIWKNKKAEYIFKKINLDLIFSQDNSNDIKSFIEKQECGVIEACFLPFLGCKIIITPIKRNDFVGGILSFEAIDDFYKENLLKQTDKMVSMLSSNLRLPMHLITNALDMLNYDVCSVSKDDSICFDENKLKKYINVIENNTYKMFRVCQNLSELVRFSTDTNPFKKTIIKIKDYISELMNNCCDYIKLSHHQAIYNFTSTEDAAVLMSLDCEKFELAIANVVLNACQYSNRHTNVTLEVVISKDLLRVSISDEGKGIPEDKICDVYRPYTTLSESNIISNGIGIGLTLAKYVVEKHNGSINIFSKEDVGTKVVIEIPAVCEEEDNGKLQMCSSGVLYKSKLSTLMVQFSPLL